MKTAHQVAARQAAYQGDNATDPPLFTSSTCEFQATLSLDVDRLRQKAL